jgi:hypothetical protein
MAKSKGKLTLARMVQIHHPEFADEVSGLSVADLESRLASLAKHAEEISVAKEESEALKDARARLAELSGPFNDGLKAVKLKTKYIIGLIKEKGGV